MMPEAVPTRSLNILLVEDDPIVQGTLAEFLKRHNHEVRCVGGVDRALAALAEFPCEVLISDIGLPDGSGWHLLERAGSGLCPYAIAISGFNSVVDMEDSMAAGFRYHLVKPFAMEDLLTALAEAATTLPLPVS